MKLLYDLASTQTDLGVVHGGGAYGECVFDELVRRNENATLHVTCRSREHLHVSPQTLEDNGIQVHETKDNHDLQQLIDQGSYTRFYSPLPYHLHGIDFSSVEVVYTIHGLRPIELPTDSVEYRYRSSPVSKVKMVAKQLFRSRYVAWRKQQFREVLQLPARTLTIVVPSQHTKFSLAETFPFVSSNDIHVLYSPQIGSAVTPKRENDLRSSALDFTRPFILLVSGGRWIKNAYRAVQALDHLFDDFRNLPHQVVLTGVADDSVFLPLTNPNRFVFLDYVSRKSLEALYRDADLFMYPTLNEGFGYPPLEAMRYGTPVICSAVTSLPEVCRDAADYFDPRSRSEMRARALRYCIDEAARQHLGERGRAHYASMQQKQSAMLDTLCSMILASSLPS
jgi:glycosyltransferase involved in cell wall biosynthesis